MLPSRSTAPAEGRRAIQSDGRGGIAIPGGRTGAVIFLYYSAVFLLTTLYQP